MVGRIIFFNADHSTTEYYLWKYKSGYAQALIPFGIIFPKAFIDSLENPDYFLNLLNQFNTLVKKKPFSQNDIPLLLFALLYHHPNVQKIPDNWRWHTMGGQILSPYFNFSFNSSISILGVNASAELFGTTSTGDVINLNMPSRPVLNQKDYPSNHYEFQKNDNLLQPVRHFMSAFFTNYTSKCMGKKNIQMREKF